MRYRRMRWAVLTIGLVILVVAAVFAALERGGSL
jgi:hypothetical protein